MSTELILPPSWIKFARCNPLIGDYFFPLPTDGRHTENRDETDYLEAALLQGHRRAALAVCRACPVLYLCREYAMDDPELQGIWGGWGERRRKLERARRAKIAEARRERRALTA